MGFIHDMKKIFALLPKERQTLLFSATFSDEIRQLAQGLLKSPQSIQVTPKNSTVQRISQVWHLVGRGKKKALLAHIIESKDWSQVLVFVRTKFGANNVAEFLSKNGISAMALHGNKSQSARTQALAGFKSGSIRALVATDIAARGIDIEELPHVVNYEIPNVPEDYVHRIGRTGRAGRQGHAVNLVSLDEEGFLVAVEKFTGQEIPHEALPEYAPEAGEKAEPIAMGRQTIWGGRGKPPGREVMAAAAKAAKQDLMQRIREKKAATPSRHGGGGHDRSNNQNKKQSNTAGNNSSGSRPSTAAQGRRPEGQGGRRSAAGAGGAGARGGARPARSGGTGGSGNSSSGGNRNAGAGNRSGRAPVQVAR
jgi:ATP-dependent RNA helicase RhlE